MEQITIRATDTGWVGKLPDVPEWLPLPFTEAATSEDVRRFYADRGDRVTFEGDFTLPDCGHSVDCAGRDTAWGDYGPAPVPGPRGEWRCYHTDHTGGDGFPVPQFADMQP